MLAIDHRSSFLLWSARALGRQASVAELAELKLVVADALVLALAARASPALTAGEVGLLCEPEIGLGALERARGAGIRVIVPAERSGEDEFAFEHGEEGFASAIEELAPDAVKALVRYNPRFEDRNARSLRRLRLLGDWCAEHEVPLMLELLVPPGSIHGLTGEREPRFDSLVRPGLTLQAIAELRGGGLEPRWWKLEAQPDAASAAAVAGATGAAPNRQILEPGTSCLVLGRAAPLDVVRDWVQVAAGVAGYSGFAVGRSLWAEPLEGLLDGSLDRAAATSEIARRYLELVAAWREAAVLPERH